MADRNFYGYKLWQESSASAADLLWRMKKDTLLPCIEAFEDGSFLSVIHPNTRHRVRAQKAIQVRVIEYALDGDKEAEPVYRLITTILDPKTAPARDLAALYFERWEIETAFDEFKTHLRARGRS